MNTLHPDLQRFRTDLRDAIASDLERRRSRRTRTWVVRIGVPGFAVALGLSLTLVLAGPQAAFAGWSPSPSLASTGQTSAAGAACLSVLATAPPISSGVAPGGGWRVVATDVRGPFTLEIDQNGSDSATCLSGPSMTLVSQNTAGGGSLTVSRGGSASGRISGWSSIGSSSVLSTSGSGSFEHVTLSHFASTGQGAYTVIEGQLDEGVTGVTLVLSDGEHVQATAGNGYFVAWWPGSLDATAAEITTANGVTTQTLTFGTPPTPSPPIAPGGGGNT